MTLRDLIEPFAWTWGPIAVMTACWWIGLFIYDRIKRRRR